MTPWTRTTRRSTEVMFAFITRVHQGSSVELCPLIADWSDDDVFRYIAEHGIKLPEQYSIDPPALRSLECWSCTALLDESDRLNYTRVHHPELWARLRPRLLAVYQVMREAANGNARVLGGVLRAEEEARAALVANLQAELQSNGEETTDAREVKADTAYTWLKAGEEAEEDRAAPGKVSKCAPERGAPGHDLVDRRARS